MNSCQIQIVENLVLKASEILNVPATEIKGKGKKEECCIARGLVWVACKHKSRKFTFNQLGQYFSRDRTTIWSGYKNIKNDLQVNLETAGIYEKLINEI
jgi:chromosomal replication initiation ATPase DnaA